ncbi:MAG: Ribosomal large subunit pseudouridine synthase D [Candidatus Ordinivivax streblomastigis]|uniref:Pseudouridine synthase n=1 Tax=Candidatus Ordinivivax streblomastigis TaxID=2540710 RepID=A0A5M8P227_9BACT|nr:MAG: Ribosomal large subunit pseudouridine synthase D [Candidatus Ordinivivax streblomastigis]
MKYAKETGILVKEPMPLSRFFDIHFRGKSRSDIKSMLAHKQIRVNERPVFRLEYMLLEGDTVSIHSGKSESTPRLPGLKIVYEDDYLIVIEKEGGLLAVGTNTGKEETTAFGILLNYLKKQNPRNRLYIVHRIDRATSGLMMFVKSPGIQHAMRDNWNDTVTERVYVAVVEGVPNKEADTIASYLYENKMFKVFSLPTNNDGSGKWAVTHYKVIRKNELYALLEVELETGRKNQIRVQMESIGHPIVGDIKYGAAVSTIGRVALHAKVLAFIHPVTNEVLRFETPVPPKFNALF